MRRRALVPLLGAALSSRSRPATAKRAVVIYCAVDDFIARPILDSFQKKTAIRARPVFDSEATKSVGLAVRLVNEKSRPRCDVFWNGEFSRTLFLKSQGALASYRSRSARDIPERFKDGAGFWTGYACRARVIAFHPGRVKKPPQSIFHLTAQEWRGRVAICDPLIGTAAAWASALFEALGEAKADAFFRALRANGAKIVPGNSVAADLIVRGVVDLGVVDNDDVFVRKQKGKPIALVYPDQEGLGTLLVPATAALIGGAPHPQEAKALLDYLLTPEVESRLAQAAGHMSVRGKSELAGVKSMTVPYERIAARLTTDARRLQQLLQL